MTWLSTAPGRRLWGRAEAGGLGQRRWAGPRVARRTGGWARRRAVARARRAAAVAATLRAMLSARSARRAGRSAGASAAHQRQWRALVALGWKVNITLGPYCCAGRARAHHEGFCLCRPMAQQLRVLRAFAAGVPNAVRHAAAAHAAVGGGRDSPSAPAEPGTPGRTTEGASPVHALAFRLDTRSSSGVSPSPGLGYAGLGLGSTGRVPSAHTAEGGRAGSGGPRPTGTQP